MMPKSYILPTLIAMIALMTACATSPQQQTTQTEPSQTSYAPPTVPVELSDDDRLNFLTQNFWNNFDFSDSTLIHNTEYTEKAFLTYIAMLNQCEEQIATAGIITMLRKARTDTITLIHFAKLCEKYLYINDTPNDKLYLVALNYIIDSSKLENKKLQNAKQHIKVINRNTTGSLAPNFTTQTTDNKNISLHQIKANYTVLFFNNPNGEDSQLTTEYINYSKMNEIPADKLQIIAICVGNDQEKWRKTTYAQNVLNTFDLNGKLQNSNTYDLRRTPKLYLLDSQKRIIKKHATIEQIQTYLEDHLNLDKQPI